MIQEKLHTTVREALQALDIPDVEFVIEYPSDLKHGDFATNVALVAEKPEGDSPATLAKRLVAELEQQQIEGIADITVAGPGFINFTLSSEYFAGAIEEIRNDPHTWGRSDAHAGARVMVEYTQPNPFKVFHIGHLMSNAIGESISRLVACTGAEVHRANYQGDVGPHVAKALYGLVSMGVTADDEITPDILGEAYVAGTKAYEENEEAKTEIDAINKAVYAGTGELMPLYHKGREVSLAHFEELYRVLGTTFDVYFFEGEVWKEGERRVREGLKQGIFEESDGAIIYRGERNGLHTRVFITSAGIPTYEAKEIGLAFAKKETWAFDKNVTVTAVEQNEYFKVIRAALSKMDAELAEKYSTVHHGMMQLANGKMSSRKGNVVTGESIIETMRERAVDKIADRNLSDKEKGNLADAVAVAAIKYSILKQSTGKNIAFDPDVALSFEGDSGPYLQYTYARIQSVLRKAATEGVKPTSGDAPQEPEPVARLLPRFPEVLARAQEEYEPHHVATYLIELASAFNSWYGQEIVVDATDRYSPYKVALAEAVGHTLKNGLWCLGIEAPERM